jgi:hypothetical protein
MLVAHRWQPARAVRDESWYDLIVILDDANSEKALESKKRSENSDGDAQSEHTKVSPKPR